MLLRWNDGLFIEVSIMWLLMLFLAYELSDDFDNHDCVLLC